MTMTMTDRKTIAVIDDDIHIGDMLSEVLQREGYGVLRAYSGTEALLLLEQKKPDLILLDLMLPGLTGEEVLPRLQGIPTIVVSAKVDVNDKVALLLGGSGGLCGRSPLTSKSCWPGSPSTCARQSQQDRL